METEASKPSKRPHGNTGRRMVNTPAGYAAVEARRLYKQIIVTGVKVASTVTVIPYEELGTLQIDDYYQRGRITRKVNPLIHVLMSGGQIPDPVDVAERPDGTRWLVDGQQRYWAHVDTKRPLKAHIHLVDSKETEVKLFYALNARYGLTPKNVLKGWPGPIGKLLRKWNTDEKSPLRDMIDLGSGNRPIDGVALAKSVLLVITGVWPRGDTATVMLPRVDTALGLAGGHAWAEDYMRLMVAVFGPSTGRGGTRVRVLPMLALANVAHRKYVEMGRPVFPRTTTYLKRVNWDNVVPNHSLKYLALLENKIEKVWR